jgi:hypothetical protein
VVSVVLSAVLSAVLSDVLSAVLSAAELLSAAEEESALLLELDFDEASDLLLDESPQAANDITITAANTAARIFFIVILSFHYCSESLCFTLSDIVFVALTLVILSHTAVKVNRFQAKSFIFTDVLVKTKE